MPVKMKVCNPAEYNNNLRDRGRIFHLLDEAEKVWLYIKTEKVKKSKFVYSDLLMQTLAVIRYLLKYPYRQLQGFLEDYINYKKINLPIPDFTTLSRRMSKLSLEIRDHRSKSNTTDPIEIAIDSTGINIYHTGGGHSKDNLETRKFKHLEQVRKLHVALNPETKEVLAMQMTEGHIADGDVIPNLLNDIPDYIEKLYADGAYDRKTVRLACYNRKIKQVIPPSKVSVTRRASKEEHEDFWDERNEAVLMCNYLGGRKLWKKMTNYHRRSLIEAFFGKIKMIFGFHFMNRSEKGRKVELAIKIKMLNSYRKGAAKFIAY
jgi:DDE family transposase